MEVIKGMAEFIEEYIEGSTIKEMKYIVGSGKWTVIFNDSTFLNFNSFYGLYKWMQADQFGD